MKLRRRWSRVIDDWDTLERDAETVYEMLDRERRLAFEELILISIRLYANLNRMYCSGERLTYRAMLTLLQLPKRDFMPPKAVLQPTHMPKQQSDSSKMMPSLVKHSTTRTTANGDSVYQSLL